MDQTAVQVAEQATESSDAPFEAWASELLGSIIVAAVIVVAILVLSRVTTKLIRKALGRTTMPQTAVKIIVNCVRAVWIVLAISVVLELVFNIDVNALVAALGVGGLAFSLGFQDTLKNLIGGVQVSMQKIVDIGDRVEISGMDGVVTDFNWRHTTMVNDDGDTITVPNSLMNSDALLVHHGIVWVSASMLVRYEQVEGMSLNEWADMARGPVFNAIKQVATPAGPLHILFGGSDNFGYKCVVSLKIVDDVWRPVVSDAIVRCISELELPFGEKSKRTRVPQALPISTEPAGRHPVHKSESEE